MTDFSLHAQPYQYNLLSNLFSQPNLLGVISSQVGTFIKIVNALGVSSDMVLTDVLETGYTVKNSMLNEKLEKLAPEDRNRIYEVIDTLVKQSKQILS